MNVFGATAALSVAALVAGAMGTAPLTPVASHDTTVNVQAPVYSAADVALAGKIRTVTISMTDKVLMVDGTNLKMFKPSPIEEVFGGMFADFDYKVVDYPRNTKKSSEKIGTANLLVAIDQTVGNVVIVGFSQGANVNKKVRKQLVKEGDLSRVGELTFIDYGSPAFLESPDSEFRVIKVAFEYDGVANWPNIFNGLAMLNALAGATKIHPQAYADADINRDAKWVKYDGNTTYVVLGNDHLALTPSWLKGTPLGDLFEAIVRPGIDRSYRWEKQGFVKVTEPILEVTDTSQVARQATAQFVTLDPVLGESSPAEPEPKEEVVSHKAKVESTPPAEPEQLSSSSDDLQPEASEQVADDKQDVTPVPELEPTPDKVDLDKDDPKPAPGKDDSDDDTSTSKDTLSKKETAKESAGDSDTKSERSERRSAKRELKRERTSTTASSGSTDSDD